MSGGEPLDATRQKVDALKQKYSEIERIIQERKRNRAKLLEKTLSGTTVLSTELDKLAILSDEENKSKFVYDLTRGRSKRNDKNAAFNLSDILSNKQADFETSQESQAFYLAKLRGQQASAKSSLHEFRREHGEAPDEGEGEGDEGAPTSAVLRRVEKSFIGDNFRLRCLKSEVEAARSLLEPRGLAEPSSTSTLEPELDKYGRDNVLMARSIVDDVLDLSLEEAQKREALLQLKRMQRLDDVDETYNLEKAIRIVAKEYTEEVIRNVGEEIGREIKESFEEAKRFACRLETEALVEKESVRNMKPFKDRDSLRATSAKVRTSLASVLGGMSAAVEVNDLFGGTSLFNDFLYGSQDKTAKPRRSKLNLEKLSKPRDSSAFKDKEVNFWSKISLETSQVTVEAKNKSAFSCVRCSHDGVYLAAGSVDGGIFVWNLRLNSKLVLQLNRAKKKKKRTDALSLCWSYDNLQVAILFGDGSLAIYSLKNVQTSDQVPEEIQPADDKKEKEDSRKHKIAFLSSAQVCKSSHALTSDSSYSDRVKVSFGFCPKVTIAGHHPCLAVPSTHGDTAVVAVHQADAPLLDDLEEPRERAEKLRNRETLDFLSRPSVACDSDIKQVLHHGHSNPVVFAGYASGTSTLVTVDASGEISLWPSEEAKRTGFGWHAPKQTWNTDLKLSVLRVLETIPIDIGNSEQDLEDGEGTDANHEGRVSQMRQWLTSYKYVGSKRNLAAVRQVIHVSQGSTRGGATAYISEYSQEDLKARTRVKVSLVWRIRPLMGAPDKYT